MRYIDIINERDVVSFSGMSKDKLKKAVSDAIKKLDISSKEEADLLEDLAQTLIRDDLVDRIAEIKSSDSDVGRFFENITAAFLYTKGTIDEKHDFIDDMKNDKQIDTQKLLTSGKIQKIDDWFTGSTFGRQVFNKILPDITQGAGPGEIALSVFSRKIKASGAGSEAGDLQINGKSIELKTRLQSGGRWGDPRRANANMHGNQALMKMAASKYGFQFGSKQKASLVRFLDVYAPAIPSEGLKELVPKLMENIFSHLSKSDFRDITDTIVSGDKEKVKKEFLKLAFYNYKVMEPFNGILIFDAKMGISKKKGQDRVVYHRPENWITLYFEDIEDVIDMIKVDGGGIVGPEQEMFPKANIQ